MEDPSLLCNKVELQALARQKLHNEGFNYKKKSSRSKAFGNTVSEQPDRKNLSQDFRQKRVAQIHEDLKEVDLQLSYAMKQREKCANVSNFSKALDVSKEMDELRSKKRKYQEELTILQKKEAVCKRAKKCAEKKAERKDKQQSSLTDIFLKESSSSSSAQTEKPESTQETGEANTNITENF